MLKYTISTLEAELIPLKGGTIFSHQALLYLLTFPPPSGRIAVAF
jgi:hypothetical protein